MGLYLSIFDEDCEINGVEVGPYLDFNKLKAYIIEEFESGEAGGRFPTFILHSDCDGEWTSEECYSLKAELAEIASLMHGKPPIPFVSEWQAKIAKSNGMIAKNSCECFIDVDGEPVILRILDLVDTAIERHLPILFQ